MSLDIRAAAWRSGRNLVVDSGADLSHRCFLCGQPAVKPHTRSMSWHPPSWYILALAGIVPYVVAAIFVRRNCTVRLGLCQRHIVRRRLGFATGWVLFLAAVFCFILAAGDALIASSHVNPHAPPPSTHTTLYLILGAAFFVASGLWAMYLSTWLGSPVKIIDGRAWIRGAAEGFVGDLPELPAIRA